MDLHHDDAHPLTIVAVSAGIGQPSATRMLTDRIVSAVADHAATRTTIIELRPLAHDIATATVSGHRSAQLESAIDNLTSADGVVLASPIYKAGYSGLFKSFLDLLDNDALLAVPVLLAATGGSPRHALAVDAAMRPLAGYLRAMATPTAVFASPDDWNTAGDAGLHSRIVRAAGELVALARSGAGRAMRNAEWGTYQRTLDLRPRPGQPAAPAPAGQASDDFADVAIDPALLRAATGGSLL